MKRECLISRLNEPNIAHLYIIESDQNLINNIRVLCTKHPDTLKYFVPEELFWEIKNGELVAMTADCYDEYGRKLMTIDPLKVISEQFKDAGIYLYSHEGLEIRLQIEGYELAGAEGKEDTLARPAKYLQRADSAPRRGNGRYAGRDGGSAQGRKGGSSYRSGSYGGASGGSSRGTSGGEGFRGEDYDDRPMRRRRRKGSVFKGIALAALILAAAVGVLVLRDTSVKRFEERLSASDYQGAVAIYNEEILGHRSREEQADPEIKGAVDSVKNDYMAEELSYEDASSYLNILTGVSKKDLSDKAQSALDEVELYEASSTTMKEGMALMEEQDYVKAIEVLLGVDEASTIYPEAQEKIGECVSLLIESGESAESEEECLAAIAQIDAAAEILPEYGDLKDGRAACQSKYESLVRSGAISEADELAAGGDYAGAFERIDAGLGILAEDEQLGQKVTELQKSFVDYVTREALSKVDAGDFEAAGALVEESSEVYSCGELDTLREQIGESENWSAPAASEYQAGKVTYTEYPGELKDKTKKKAYTLKVAESGVCIWEFTRMESKLKVELTVKGPGGTEIVREKGLADGSKVYCTLEKGQSYTAEVTATEGEGGYVLLLGQPKGTVDVSGYDRVTDSIEYKDQLNRYTFVPEITGTYRFEMESSANDFPVKFEIYDSGNSKTGGEMKNGDAFTVEMTAGGQYRIEAGGSGKTGGYAFSIRKPEVSRDVTGRSIICDAVTYSGQKKSYTFKAAGSGQYRITVGNMGEGNHVKLYVYSSLGDEIAGAEDLGNGGSVSAGLTEGQGYQIQLTQSSGTGSYTITLVKEGTEQAQ